MGVPPRRFANFLYLFQRSVRSDQPITSDHTRQAIKIEEIDKEERVLLTVFGATWNTMDFGINVPDLPHKKGYPNNPFKQNESYKSYVARKKLQLADLLNQITATSTRGEYPPVNFILLQEADWLVPASKIFKGKLPESFKKELEIAKDNFIKKIDSLGWHLQTPSSDLNIQGFKCILYNTTVLEFRSDRGLFPSRYYQGRNTGYGVLFVHKATGRQIAITTIHFDGLLDPALTSNYSQQVLDYQISMRNTGILTIIGGDTNRAQNIDQIGLIGARDYATQVGGEDVDEVFRTRRKATADFPMEYPKRYDGFFACPGSLITRIRATELKGMYFKKRPTVGDKPARVFANILDPRIDYETKLQRDAKLQKREILGKNVHIHINGHNFNMAFGWPYLPSKIKVFLQRLLNLVPVDPRITLPYGTIDIAYCFSQYPHMRDTAAADFIEINTLYSVGLAKYKEEENPLFLFEYTEPLNRIRIDKDFIAINHELLRMYKSGATSITQRAEEERIALERAKKDAIIKAKAAAKKEEEAQLRAKEQKLAAQGFTIKKRKK